jgi:hypothetical protein
MKKIFILLLFSGWLASVMQSSAQNSDKGIVGIGQWRMHVPYNKAVAVTDGNGKVFCASRYGLWSVSKGDGEIERYSRISGLSDFEIATVRYNSSAGVLVIAYENSNIDLLFDDNTIVNLSDIKRNNIVGNKSINSIFFKGHEAYLSCGFGIVVLNLDKKEIKDTYYIGPNGSAININDLTADNNFFYAASDNGIYKAAVNNPYLYDYTQWSKDSTLLRPNARYSSITFFANKIFTVNADTPSGNDTLMEYDGNAWTGFPYSGDFDMGVSSYQDHMMIRTSYTIVALNQSLSYTHHLDWNRYPNMQPKDGFVSSDNSFWIADNTNGLVLESPSGDYSNPTPPGPRAPAVYSMAIQNEDLWVASGGVVLQAPAYFEYGAYHYSAGDWKTFDKTNDALYRSLGYFSDLVYVAIDPSDAKHAYMGTWGSGMMEFRDQGIVAKWDSSDCPIQPIDVASPGYNLTAIGGLAYDNDKNLWIANCRTARPLVILKHDGTWTSVPLPSQYAINYFYGLIIDDYDQKWIIARGPNAVGLIVYNQNVLDNPNDDSYRMLTKNAGEGNLPSIGVYSMAKDKDGAIWIGTDQGVAVVYNPGNVFSGGNYDAQQVLIEQDGHTQYLLETETVLAIAVDGANRKWFGTLASGVYLMSADGTQQLQHFTVDNSPMLSNFVNCIAINDQTGEVFFGNEKGIVSYRSDATAGGEACNGSLVFPNPVTHEYTGPIAIKGLVNNADVRITDISGSLIYHTKAKGGEAIWYGTNFKGERANTGVYLVYATNDDASETCVTKLLFVH